MVRGGRCHPGHHQHGRSKCKSCVSKCHHINPPREDHLKGPGNDEMPHTKGAARGSPSRFFEGMKSGSR